MSLVHDGECRCPRGTRVEVSFRGSREALYCTRCLCAPRDGADYRGTEGYWRRRLPDPSAARVDVGRPVQVP